MDHFPSEPLVEESQRVEIATSRIFELEKVLEAACSAIQVALGFEFMAVQLVRPVEKIIETVYGSGRADGWAGRARHNLQESKGERDIQTDIFLSRRIEVIAGKDRRFDDWVYTEFNHKELVRIFAPIFLARDKAGRVIPGDWFEAYRWKNRVLRDDAERHHNLIVMRAPGGPSNRRDIRVEAIGTVEAGREDRKRGIGTAEAIDFVKHVARHAHRISQSLLTSLLETIAEGSKRLTDADCSILDLDYNPANGRYTYVCPFGISQRFLEQNPPRPNGLGRQAVACRLHKIAFGPELSNPAVYAAGYHTTGVFPMFVEDRDGVLYLHHKGPFFEDENQIELVVHFLSRAVAAIRLAMNYRRERDRVRELRSLHSVLESLVSQRSQKDLLRHISWNALNVLAASLVIIYEYSELDHQFDVPPDIAGRLKEPEAMQTRVLESDVPERVISEAKPVYSAASSSGHAVLGDPGDSERLQRRFIGREKIVSSAGIPLKVGGETVGVMFIHYRWHHAFTEEEKKVIETLASTAAIAIQNRRLLDEVLKAQQQLVATPDLSTLMDLIVKGAAQVTHADCAEGYYLDPLDRELVLMAQYPRCGAPFDRRIKVGEGIIGNVAATGESELRCCAPLDPQRVRAGEGYCAQLCVPLVDEKDKKKRVLGVLLLEKTREAADHSAFAHAEIRALKVLAQPAVIAMSSALSQKQRDASDKLAALGAFVTAQMHHMRNDIGALILCARDLQKLEGLVPAAEKLIGQVYDKVESIRGQVQQLGCWIIKDSEPVDICTMLQDYLKGDVIRKMMPANITVIDALPPDLPSVMGNREQLTEVFANLIKNAVEAMPEGGRLEVCGRLDAPGKKTPVTFWVKDTGVGIPEAVRLRIFERGVTSKREGGLGVGLWWTLTYLESLGGQISVESRPGDTTFTVRLPTCEQE
jgi:signal transduction histidine kinase